MSAASRKAANLDIGATLMSKPLEEITGEDIARVYRTHRLAGQELAVFVDRARAECSRQLTHDVLTPAQRATIVRFIELVGEGLAAMTAS